MSRRLQPQDNRIAGSGCRFQPRFVAYPLGAMPRALGR